MMRRAGFGAPREELEDRDAKGYSKTVQDLIDPEDNGVLPFDSLSPLRYMPDLVLGYNYTHPAMGNWMYRMINTPRPLEEKITLFWHQVFATGTSKLDHSHIMTLQIALFRRFGRGSYRDLLVHLAKDPAMIFWLDNTRTDKGSTHRD